MPLPSSLQSLVRTRDFWENFFWDPEAEYDDDADLKKWTIPFQVGAGYGLSLSFDSGLCDFSLDFVAPRKRPVQIAWDDQAHWHPHVLRWDELERLCRVVALNDSDLSHPGMPLLLLHRFAPMCVGDDVDLIVTMLEAAWTRLGLFTKAEITKFIERNDARDAGFQWKYHEHLKAWCLAQGDDAALRALYTLRQPENAEFPFAVWNRMLAQLDDSLQSVRGAAATKARAFANSGDPAIVPKIIKQLRAEKRAELADAMKHADPLGVCWMVESFLGESPGVICKRHLNQKYEARKSIHLDVTLPMNNPKRRLPDSAAYFITTTLNHILRDLNMGEAEVSGSMSEEGRDGCLEEYLSIAIQGDVERGIRLVRETLWWSGAPETIRVRGDKSKNLLKLGHHKHQSTDAFLQVAKIRTAHFELFRKTMGHRFDRAIFSKSCRNALKDVLTAARATGPDEDGWFDVALPDGGSMGVCMRRFDTNTRLDGATVHLRKLTADASALMYELLARAELMLLPMVIATSEAEAKSIEAPWPHVRVVKSSAELLRILRKGPLDWWANRRDRGES